MTSRRDYVKSYQRTMQIVGGTGVKFQAAEPGSLRTGDIIDFNDRNQEPALVRVKGLPHLTTSGRCAFPVDRLPLLNVNENMAVAVDAFDHPRPIIRKLRWEVYDFNRSELIGIAAVLAGCTRSRVVRDGNNEALGIIEFGEEIQLIRIKSNGKIMLNGKIIEFPIVENLLTELIAANRLTMKGLEVDLLLSQRAATAKESIAPLTLTSEMTPEERRSALLEAISEPKKES